MKSLFALIAVGLDVAALRFSKSKIKKTAAAVVVGVVGVGSLAFPFLLQADDGEDNAPEVLALYVANSGSIGFEVDIDVSVPWEDIHFFDEFRLFQGGEDINVVGSPCSDTLRSKYCGWLEIPGYDGGPPLPYPGYLHSFDYTVKALKAVESTYIPLSGPPPAPPAFWFVEYETFEVDIPLYVVLNSEGTLYSMNAWASDSDGNGYEVPVYYSAGG